MLYSPPRIGDNKMSNLTNQNAGVIGSRSIKGKRCLVLGGSGFIGSHLVMKLESLGAEVTSTYFNNTPKDKMNSIQYLRCDATSKESLLKTMKDQEYVFVASAITSGSAVMRATPFVHLNDNMVMNTRIPEVCEITGVKRLLFISSSTVYPNHSRKMEETDPTNDFFPAYEIVATMKRASEQIALLYSKYTKSKLSVVIVRPSNTYGPGDDFNLETSKVLPALVRKFSEKSFPIEVWGDGNDVKDFIYIDDLADGVISAMFQGMSGEVYNIASGEETTIRNAVTVLAEISGIELSKIKYLSEIPSMIPVRRISTLKSARELDFYSTISLKEGLKKTFDWYQSQIN